MGMQRRLNGTPVLPIPSHFRLSYSNRQPCDVSHKERQPIKKLLNRDHLSHLNRMDDWTRRTFTRTSLAIFTQEMHVRCDFDPVFVSFGRHPYGT